jgi:hypothetical protein
LDSKGPLYIKDDIKLPCILLANKCDLNEMNISPEEMSKFCSESKIKKLIILDGIISWFEISKKNK